MFQSSFLYVWTWILSWFYASKPKCDETAKHIEPTPLPAAVQEEIDAGLRANAQLAPQSEPVRGAAATTVIRVLRVGTARAVYCSRQLSLLIGCEVQQRDAEGAPWRSLGAVELIELYEFEFFRLDLSSISSSEARYLKPRVTEYLCSVVCDGKPRCFRIKTDLGWFPDTAEDDSVQLRVAAP